MGTRLLAYDSFHHRGFRPRAVATRLSADQLRTIFRETVAGEDWSVIDDGNPIVAQSSLVTGVRQQIALHLDDGEHGAQAHIAAVRYSRNAFGRTAKASILRRRMNAFLTEVRRADDAAAITG